MWNDLREKNLAINTTFRQLQDFLLLRKLCKWIPSIIHFNEITVSLCVKSLDQDEFRSKLVQSIEIIRSNWNEQNLSTLSTLVVDIRDIFSILTTNQLDFISKLGDCETLCTWLLDHDSTEEFNRLLQVVRPCTDEPRLLSGIASLVHIRTLILQQLYPTGFIYI